MINQIYTIYDRVAEETSPLVEAKNDSIAIRQWNHVMADNPNSGQYDLLCIGSMDTETVKLTAYEKPIQIDVQTPSMSLTEEINE